MIRRPSQFLPAGFPKKDSPFGGRISDNVADIAPVSEFESPKLYIAGKPHLSCDLPVAAVKRRSKKKAAREERKKASVAMAVCERERRWCTCKNSSKD